MRRIPLESRNLQAIAYEPGATSFYIQFHNDEWYKYSATPDHITNIMFSLSQGHAFNMFKSEYAGIRVGRNEMIEKLYEAESGA